MNYIIDFSIVSAVYLAITAFFYQRQPKVPSVRNTLFGILLYLGVLFAVLDVLVVVIEPSAYMLPTWLIYTLQIMLLISIQISCVLFFFYCQALSGTLNRYKRYLLVILCLPFIITLIILLLTPFLSNGVFYLDTQNVYHRGSIYLLIYADTVLYVLAGLVIVLRNRKRISTKKIISIIIFEAVLFVFMLLQFSLEVYLLNATANALALTVIYHILEAPNDHIDSLTGVLNRIALSLIVHDTYEQEKRFTLFMFTIHSLRLINHAFGMRGGDEVLKDVAQYLRTAYPRKHIIRLAGDAFVVLETGGRYCTEDKLIELHDSIPAKFNAYSQKAHVDISLIAINSEEVSDGNEMIEICESMLSLHSSKELAPTILIDSSYKKNLFLTYELEKALCYALDNDGVKVFYQPIHDNTGRLAALEALVRIYDKDGKMLPTQETVELAEQNGNIHRLGHIIIETVCKFVHDNNAAAWKLHHIGVNLSALQIEQPNLPDIIFNLFIKYDISPDVIAFEITETASVSLSIVRQNMQKMEAAGFSFLLDDFGKGYANFSHIAHLPFLCIKIDKDILWEAPESPEKMAFLKGITGMLKTMNLTSVCEGVETIEQAELLTSLGVAMFQGYLYSKPLSPDELLVYINKVTCNR